MNEHEHSYNIAMLTAGLSALIVFSIFTVALTVGRMENLVNTIF